MPTIVYLVHGMGCGTDTGAPRPPGTTWQLGAVEAIKWIARTFKLSTPMVLDSIPSTPPVGSDKSDAIWIVPVTYHRVFDEFRAGAAQRETAIRGIAPSLLVDAQVTKLASVPFAWVNCLDVLLWWADTVQTRARATAEILSLITQADLLARSIKKARVRRILVSHSLGTAASTDAVRHLSTNPVWPASGGFELWCTLANVAPFLIETEDVYAPPMLPGRSGTMVQRMYNVRHEADPIPWLLPWRHWNPKHAPAPFTIDWLQQEPAGNFRLIETQGVFGPAGGGKPEITDVHGLSNYLLSSDVSLRLAGAMRGEEFSDSELSQLNVAGARTQLQALSCLQNSAALAQLKQTTAQFIGDLPFPPTNAPASSGWLNRLLRAADILVDARKAC